jgi:hypothetical protein
MVKVIILITIALGGVEGKISPDSRVAPDLSQLPDCTWKPESGGDYDAYNPSSGTYGKYQIAPITVTEYDCKLATPIGQERCAQKIYAKEGTSPWVNCG